MSDTATFLRAWLSDPLRVAAVAPSSRMLGELMTREIGPATGSVLELGPGTGVFTRALRERGVPEDTLVLIEQRDDFIAMLKGRFPRASVLRGDAARLSLSLPHGMRFGAVVSGLPLLSMTRRTQFMILAGCFSHLERGGAMFQFTYGPRCPVPQPILDRLGLDARRVAGTLCNIPPAAVYKITRKLN